MKCGQCQTKNDPKNKFCKECGATLQGHSEHDAVSSHSELYGKEVDILFYLDRSTGKISGFVNPTEDQVAHYKKDGVLQKVVVESPDNANSDENVSAVLAFIKQSKEFLSEDYDESFYKKFSVADLKKEYLRLFEKVLKAKAQRGMK